MFTITDKWIIFCLGNHVLFFFCVGLSCTLKK